MQCTYLSSFNSSPRAARSEVGIMRTQSGFSPVSARARPMSPARDELVPNASLPPRRIAALPLFRHRAAQSTVTFGRLS